MQTENSTGVMPIADHAQPPPSVVQLRINASGTILCELVAGLPFDLLRVSVREAFAATNDKHRGQTVRLDIGRRDFDLFDLRRIVNMIKDEFGVQVTGLNCPSEALAKFAERELKIRVHASQVAFSPEPVTAPRALDGPPVRAADAVLDVPDERQTEATELVSPPDEAEPGETGGDRSHTIHGTIRSGAVVRHTGDVHIFGDVNPGAQIFAGGSVFVYGTLKGLASAGSRGGMDAIILAFDMRPSQLRIGKVIQIPTQIADRPLRYTPEVAWVSGGSIVIEAYRGRHPHQREA
ncbi:MAG: septum site-determining protein MinC [Myxococcales bacterium]|nr:septum site-determining protein MinC [Myxococcales bacterium]